MDRNAARKPASQQRSMFTQSFNVSKHAASHCDRAAVSFHKHLQRNIGTAMMGSRNTGAKQSQSKDAATSRDIVSLYFDNELRAAQRQKALRALSPHKAMSFKNSRTFGVGGSRLESRFAHLGPMTATSATRYGNQVSAMQNSSLGSTYDCKYR